MNVDAQAGKIKLLILDVDGVMTDGRVVYADSGEELKFFDVRDGHGIKLLMRAGIEVALVTGRRSAVVQKRADDLGIGKVYQKALKKIEAYEEILSTGDLTDEQVAVVGDDLPDLPLLRRCGLAVCVKNGIDEAKKESDYITSNEGGRGAVREVCELILKAQGLWEKVTKRYY